VLFDPGAVLGPAGPRPSRSARVAGGEICDQSRAASAPFGNAHMVRACVLPHD
jgi:hypothetical protein